MLFIVGLVGFVWLVFVLFLCVEGVVVGWFVGGVVDVVFVMGGVVLVGGCVMVFGFGNVGGVDGGVGLLIKVCCWFLDLVMFRVSML